MASIVTLVAVTTEPVASNVFFGLLAALMWIGFLRTLSMGVTADPDGIVMREVMRTVRIPWSEDLEIRNDHLTSGAAGLLGATTPVVIRRGRQGRGNERVELSVLGTYGLSSSTADCAIVGLNACFEEWKLRQGIDDRSDQPRPRDEAQPSP